jgi:tetratricopeptide (TPR) repeat protein
MALDTRNVLNRVLGVRTVTNAFLLDEEGILRWQHLHGFRVARPEMMQTVERVVAGDLEEIYPDPTVRQESLDVEVLRAELAADPDNPDYMFMLAEALCQDGETEEGNQLYRRVLELDPSNSAAGYALGSLLAEEGDKEGAAAVMRRALEIDPMNFTIRKQIWRLEHPEKFYPKIDMAFQVDQIKREGFPDLSKLPISIRRELELEELEERTVAGNAGAAPPVDR